MQAAANSVLMRPMLRLSSSQCESFDIFASYEIRLLSAGGVRSPTCQREEDSAAQAHSGQPGSRSWESGKQNTKYESLRYIVSPEFSSRTSRLTIDGEELL